MPEYLAPGVYIEEVSYRAKTIEGVSTSTAGFIGPALFGPVDGVPELLTSLADYERIYGSLDPIQFSDESDPSTNFLAQSVRAFFENGGKRLYVGRLFDPPTGQEGNADYGKATASITGTGGTLDLKARYPGGGGELTLTFTIRATQNVLSGVPRDPLNPQGPRDPAVRGLQDQDVVWISDLSSPYTFSNFREGQLYTAERYFSPSTNRWTYRFRGAGNSLLEMSDLTPGVDKVLIITCNVDVVFPGMFPRVESWTNLRFDPDHALSLFKVFADPLPNRIQQLTNPLVVEETALSGWQVARVLMTQTRPAQDRPRLLRALGVDPAAPGSDAIDLSILATIDRTELGDSDRRFTIQLSTTASNGERPKPRAYEGDDTRVEAKSGLKAFEDIADISIVAAPGYSAMSYLSAGDREKGKVQIQQIMGHLISHCERMRYRVAVLDSAEEQAISEVREYRAQVDSTHAALYYPWIRILDPISNDEISVPPSGFVAGIYARNDIEKGVHKAPANEVVRLAVDFEFVLNKAQQDVLNPEGINAFRYFEGRGRRLWGARTISSDPEWKYINVRRYFAYLERSVERGTQWVVFENNVSSTWANVRRTVEDFLYNEWKNGRVMGDKPEEAYFVRCDRSTMTQNDIDNGRLVVLVGICPVRPAEFVIFRIGQWTSDRKV